MSFAHRGFKYSYCEDQPWAIRHEISYPKGHVLPGPWSTSQEATEKMFIEHVDWVLSHPAYEVE
jgi:hypothetical protein